MKKLLSGNAAIARGAWEAGCAVAAAYPGTPSTEILEYISQNKEIRSQWSPNEKVSLEVASGASLAGARSLVAMKHVGLNVAADPLFTLSYTGVRGGLVIVVCDDPGMHSSQNEQDSRHYARSAKIPMLEPSDADEALRFTKIAFELSEKFDTPVLLRGATRVCHGNSLAETGERITAPLALSLEKNSEKYVMIPAHARKRHPQVEARMQALADFAETFSGNVIEPGSGDFGFITSGAPYQYVRESFPNAPVLKLGMVHPLPKNLIKKFVASVKKVFVVEELDPFFEEQIKAMGLNVIGKELIPVCGELNPEIIKMAVTGKKSEPSATVALPPRPPILCAGCPHRGVYVALKKFDVFVCGDIGCYTLGTQKPLSCLDTCLCMGAGIGQTQGIRQALGAEQAKKTVAVIGDSTFLHSGMTGLLDLAANNGATTVIILDNRITAMTGHQPTAGSGRNLAGESPAHINFENLGRALGIPLVQTVNPLDVEQTSGAIKKALEFNGPSLIVSCSPCVLIPEFKMVRKDAKRVDMDLCVGCKACLQVACPALAFSTEEPAGSKRKGHAFIEPALCTGCGICASVCKKGAIK